MNKKQLTVSLKIVLDESGLAEKGMALFIKELFTQYQLESSIKTKLTIPTNIDKTGTNMITSEMCR